VTATVTIPARFKGPPQSGNGGYAAGLLARHVDAPAVEVRLVSPPPLDAPLTVVEAEDGLEMRDENGRVVARARPWALDLPVPAPVSLEDATVAARAPVFDPDLHPFPTCFGCGPLRDPGDAVRHICGRVPGREDVVACPANTSPELPNYDGALATEVVWAGLDCPSAAACLPANTGVPYVLGTFTVRIDRPVVVGEPHVVIAWSLGGEGRKSFGASAILDAEGRLCALGSAVWIALRPAAG
jgi:hypothetical protein